MTPRKYNVSNILSFTYKGGRKVIGEVLRIDKKGVLIKLQTDYIGKNVDFFKGEHKYFIKSIMK